jgi:V/A-type H+-transporting ATPase subunit C
VPGSLRTYARINARLRARISKMLAPEFLAQLDATRSLPECVQLLRETDFGAVEPAYRRTGDIRMAELALYGEEIRLYRDLEAMSGGPLLSFIQALCARFEIDNVKNALRLWFDAHIRQHTISGASGYLYREPIHHKLNLDAVVNAADLSSAAAALAPSPYAQIVLSCAEDVEARGSLFPVEVALDRFYYDTLLTAVGHLGARDRNIARRIIGIDIDWQNVLWIIRVQRFYGDQPETFSADIVPGGMYISETQLKRARSADDAEQLLRHVIRRRYPSLVDRLNAVPDNALYPRLAMLEGILTEIRRIEARRALCGYPFSVGMILAYFVLKEEELQRLITILNAKVYGTPATRREARARA